MARRDVVGGQIEDRKGRGMILYILGGVYLLTSLFLIIGWTIKRVRRNRILKEIEEAENQDPFFDKFYPHF